MPLEVILQALEAKFELQAAEIEQTAQVQIAQIREEAKARTAAVRQERLADVQAPLQSERARILNRAKMEAQQAVMGTREALIDAVLQEAARRLAALPGSETYSELLHRLVQEAIGALGPDGPLHLRVRRCDVALLNHLVRDMDLTATVQGDLEQEPSLWGCLGGVIAVAPDGRIKVVNTLDARLQRVATLYRAQIAHLIFGDQEEG